MAFPPANPGPLPAAPTQPHDDAPWEQPRWPHPDQIRAQQFFQRWRKPEWSNLAAVSAARASIRLHRRSQCNRLPLCFQFAIDTKMVAAKCARLPRPRRAAWVRRLLGCPFAFHRFQAAAIKLKQLVHILFRLGRRRAAEARRAGSRTSYTGGSRDKFKQVECDIFIAADAKRAASLIDSIVKVLRRGCYQMNGVHG